MFTRLIFLTHLFNFVLIGPLSLSQVGLMAMFGMLFFDAFFSRKLIIDGRMFGSLFSSAILLFGIVAIGMSGHIDGDSLGSDAVKRLLSWIFIWISIIFGYRYSHDLLGESAIVFFTRLALGLASFLVLQILLIGPGAIASLRLTLQELLPSGLNGFLLSLLALQAFGMIVLLKKGSDPIARMLACVALIVPFVANLLLGSRQYALGFLLMIVLVVLSIGTARQRLRRLVVIGVFAGIGVGLIMLSGGVFESTVLDRIDQSQRQATSGSDRLLIWLAAIDLIDGWPWLGSGVGFAAKSVGRYIDNFYLEFIIDYGLLALGLLFWCIFLLMRSASTRIAALGESGEGYHAIRGYLIVALSWFPIFNEVVREYFLWILIGALLGLGKGKSHSSSQKIRRVTRVAH